MKKMFLLISFNTYVFANVDEGYKNCKLDVIFDRVGESFEVKQIEYSKPRQYGILYNKDKFEPSSDNYVITMERSKLSWSWQLAFPGFGGAYIASENHQCMKHNIYCWGCVGTSNACKVLLNTKSLEMLESGFHTNFLTSQISKPYINACENYIAAEHAKQIAVDKIRKTKEQDFNTLFLNETKILRSTLKPSDITNCGIVIEIKSKEATKMVRVQTGGDAGVIWTSINNIFPQFVDNKIIGCKDGVSVYKAAGVWLRNDGKLIFTTTQSYDPN
jgi:hypothetical protein